MVPTSWSPRAAAPSAVAIRTTSYAESAAGPSITFGTISVGTQPVFDISGVLSQESGVGAFLRAHGTTDRRNQQWLERHNLDRIERWELGRQEILDNVDDVNAAQQRQPKAQVVKAHRASPFPI